MEFGQSGWFVWLVRVLRQRFGVFLLNWVSIVPMKLKMRDIPYRFPLRGDWCGGPGNFVDF